MATLDQIREQTAIQKAFDLEAKAAAQRIVADINKRYGINLEVRPARTRVGRSEYFSQQRKSAIAVASFELAEERRFGPISLWRQAGEIVVANFEHGDGEDKSTNTDIYLLRHEKRVQAWAPQPKGVDDKAAVDGEAVKRFTAGLIEFIDAGNLKYPNPNAKPSIIAKFFG